MKSLRHKITAGFTGIAILVTGLALFSIFELGLMEERVASGGRINDFLNSALEIRRFEKNYFLYGQEADLAENASFLSQGQSLLRDHAPVFETLAGKQRIAQLQDELEQYRRLMATYGQGPADDTLAHGIRTSGKQITTIADELAGTERQSLQAMLDRHRRLLIAAALIVSILVIGIGRWMSQRVGRPLKEMEESMGAVAAGRLTQLEMTAGDREIVSLTQAFNHVLRELELRQGQLVRSEKLATLVDETLRLMRGRIADKARIKVDIPADLEVSGDRRRLQQMFINLLNNALQALGAQGEIAIAARVGTAQRESGKLVFGHCPAQAGSVEISVSDNGAGIPAAVLPRIFDPFFTTKEVGQGVGLGLFIVFEIVEAHGGCIAVDSAPGQGTSFRMHLSAPKS